MVVSPCDGAPAIPLSPSTATMAPGRSRRGGRRFHHGTGGKSGLRRAGWLL